LQPINFIYSKSMPVQGASSKTLMFTPEPTTKSTITTTDLGDKTIVCDGTSCTIIRKPKPKTVDVLVDVKTKPETLVSAATAASTTDEDEPLLMEDRARFVLFPIRYPKIMLKYKEALASFWTVEEVDLGDDIRSFATLTSDEQHFIKHVLAFFASADLLVMDNLAGRFLNDIKNSESKCFYSVQIMQESIHSEMYGLLLDTYVKDTAEKAKLFNAIETMPAIKAKADWALKWMASTRPFSERLLAFACIEGIGFSGSFCAIFWLKKRGKMPGLTFSNELISRDEGLHTDFATLLFTMLKNKPTQQTVEDIITSMVNAEKQFITESIPVALIGMNAKSMSQYIEFVADRLIDALGYTKIYNVQNPFDWMEMLSLQGKTNFFEKRVGEYQRAGLLNVYRTRMAASDAESAAAKNLTTQQTQSFNQNSKSTATAPPPPPAAKDFIADLDC